MEWVVTTGKTIDEAKRLALDKLGVAADEAEFEILEEPRTGMFGRLKVEARVRARVKPAPVRPKQNRRDRRRGSQRGRGDGGRSKRGDRRHEGADRSDDGSDDDGSSGDAGARRADDASRRSTRSGTDGDGRTRPKRQRGQKESSTVSDESTSEVEVSPREVGDAAVAFVAGLADAIGADADADVEVDETEIDVRLTGSDLGLLVGPGGRTLAAVQDLARVAAQRRLGDHDTRLRVDVGGYREKRRAALERFAVAVAEQVKESGRAKALEPMASADRKAVHDALADVEGVSSRSEGDDPGRRVVISPD